MSDFFLQADWPAPSSVNTLLTTRRHPQGASSGALAAFNLGEHCGDEPANVAANRKVLRQHLPGNPLWLQQVHGPKVITADQHQSGIQADACVAGQPAQVCAVLTADCLPVLLCDRQGQFVAAVHAGWRGLFAGILSQTVTEIPVQPKFLLAWLGPAISSTNYAVDQAFRQRFIDQNAAFQDCFSIIDGSIRADLYQIARIQLQLAGVGLIYGGDFCTCADTGRFYSHCREPSSGRQASLIWLT